MKDSLNKQRDLQHILQQAGGPSAGCGDDGVGDLEGGQYGSSCLGFGWADVQTWELALQLGFNVNHLNETYQDVHWTHLYHYWSGNQGANQEFAVNPYGWCWANGDTFIHTHWSTQSCIPSGSYQWDGFDFATTGLYLNTDFQAVLFNLLGLYYPPRTTYVTSTPAVQWANGFANWGAQFVIDADAALLQ